MKPKRALNFLFRLYREETAMLAELAADDGISRAAWLRQTIRRSFRNLKAREAQERSVFDERKERR